MGPLRGYDPFPGEEKMGAHVLAPRRRRYRALLLFTFTASLTLGTRHAGGAGESESCCQIREQNPSAVISEIHLVHNQVFEASDSFPSWFPWRLANRLHRSTAERVIRNELLFREGDPLDPQLIQETRRNLRALDYFRDETLECSLVDEDKVRVTVSLREDWSLVPIFSAQGVDGSHAFTFGLTENNLLGWGKGLSASYRKGTQSRNLYLEDAWRVAYEDPNILGSRYRMSWAIQGLETGEIAGVDLERPFYSLETPWAASLSATHNRRKRRIVQNDSIAADYEQETNGGTVRWGLALRKGPPVVHRVETFYQYLQREIRDFQRLAEADPDLQPPPEETISAPGIGYRRLGADYIVEKRISQFERHEDFNLGNDLALSCGFSSEVLGANRDAWLLSASDSQGYAFREGHFLLAQAAAATRIESGDWRNGQISFVYDHYLRDTPLDGGPFLHTFHASAVLGYGQNLDSDRLFSLGWDSGLRGYDAGAFTGNKLFRLSLEDRIFPRRNLFGLLALGVLPFWDCGYVWQEDQPVDLGDLRQDVGLGLRIALPRVAGSNVFQLTWGVPVGRGADLSDSILTFSTSTGF